MEVYTILTNDGMKKKSHHISDPRKKLCAEVRSREKHQETNAK